MKKEIEMTFNQFDEAIYYERTTWSGYNAQDKFVWHSKVICRTAEKVIYVSYSNGTETRLIFAD